MSRYDVEYYVKLRDQMSAQLGKINQQANALNRTFSGLNKTLGTIGLALGAREIIHFGASSIKTAAEMEALNTAIAYSSGSSIIAQKNFQFLDEITSKMGLDSLAAREGFKLLAGSMQGSSISAQGQREIFEGVSTAVSVMNLSVEDSKGVFRALGQIMSKGKVQAEELRGQLGERIPSAFRIAAEAMGMTQAELNKSLELGTVYAEDFLPKFAAALKKEYEGGLESAAKTTQKSLTAMNNAWREFKVNIGSGLSPAVNYLADRLSGSNEQKRLIEQLRAQEGRIKGFLAPDLSRADAARLAIGTDITGTALFKMADEFEFYKSVINDTSKSVESRLAVLQHFQNQYVQKSDFAWKFHLTSTAQQFDKYILLIKSLKNELHGLEAAEIGAANALRNQQAQTAIGFGYANVNASIKAQQEQMKELKDLYESTTGAYAPIPGGGGASISRDALLKEIQKLERSLQSESGLLKGRRGSGGGSGTYLASRSPQNFYINISTLGEVTIENNTGSIKENTPQIKRVVAEALTEALNDVMLTARTK